MLDTIARLAEECKPDKLLNVLGHKNNKNTQIYTPLIAFESDEYNTGTATKTDEAEKLLQAGFEYACTTTENIMLSRKRK